MEQDDWNLKQHAKEIHIGDRVLIWICGKEAGIYATGKVLTEPVIRPDSAIGMNYWLTPRDGLRPIARVVVRYDKILLATPLFKEFIQCDPALWKLKILTSPRGTNFAVNEEEWRAISTWLSLK